MSLSFSVLQENRNRQPHIQGMDWLPLFCTFFPCNVEVLSFVLSRSFRVRVLWACRCKGLQVHWPGDRRWWAESCYLPPCPLSSGVPMLTQTCRSPCCVGGNFPMSRQELSHICLCDIYGCVHPHMQWSPTPPGEDSGSCPGPSSPAVAGL